MFMLSEEQPTWPDKGPCYEGIYNLTDFQDEGVRLYNV